jgi:hypothetical protein
VDAFLVGRELYFSLNPLSLLPLSGLWLPLAESANARSLWITIINTAIFVGFAAWQAMHLKKYFVTKKLIN